MIPIPLISRPLARLGLAISASVTRMLVACAGSPPSGDTVAAPAAGFVYSANEGEDSISRIDLATGRVTTLPLPVTPHNVQISRDGRRLFAVGSMAGQMKMGAPAAAPVDHAHAASKEPGGLLILSAPFSFRLHEEPHDYFRYTPHGLRSMLTGAGLEVEEIRPQGDLWSVVGHKLNSFLAFRVARMGSVATMRWPSYMFSS